MEQQPDPRFKNSLSYVTFISGMAYLQVGKWADSDCPQLGFVFNFFEDLKEPQNFVCLLKVSW